ncbi:MAG TPA: hypothetical protein VFZ61_15745 [Polyangiales bacterium]
MSTRAPRVFLLSPARCSGPRAAALPNSGGQLGALLRADGAPLGDVFAFLSALYFRGKASYAQHFGDTDVSAPGALVITPGHGLCRLSTRLRAADLAAIGRVEVDLDNPTYVEPLLRDARLLAQRAPDRAIVLLGSIATPKYVEPLLSVFGERLLFPRDFVGRGDMSRGGMLLRAVRADEELEYAPVASSVRQGPRAPRLSDLE